MQSEISIDVQGLSKSYDIFRSPGHRIGSLMFGRRKNQASFHAVKPISFQIEKGRFLGIIGQNGSGKSTLLQMICGILTPTAGSVAVRGRVAALLELGAGFNPEFTGRENARLNAQILGVSGRDLARIFPEIEAFADIGEFIDRPVKTYSSGMFVRLAFAVQACIDPDILIVDEALAVGDIFFRLKCYERLERLRSKGCTIVLVTHSMDDVMHYCDRVLLMNHGEAVYFGDAAEAVNRYYALGHIGTQNSASTDGDVPALNPADNGVESTIEWPSLAWIDVSHRAQTGDGLIHCVRVALADSQNVTKHVFHQFDVLHVYVEFDVLADLAVPVAGFVIRTDRGVVIHGKNSGQCRSTVPLQVRKGEKVRVVFDIPLNFAAGEYLLDVAFATWPQPLFKHIDRTTMAELESAAARHCVISGASSFSIVPRGHMGFEAQPFYGVVAVNSAARLSVVS